MKKKRPIQPEPPHDFIVSGCRVVEIATGQRFPRVTSDFQRTESTEQENSTSLRKEGR